MGRWVSLNAMRRTPSLTFITFAAIILLTAAALRLIGLSQYPPGPHYDEAVKLLVTRSILDGAHYFPMIEAYQGREPLYFYLGAPMLAFVQDSPFAFRILSAFINLITIAASMALGRAIFPGRRGMIIGIAVGVMMAVSFHQVWLSRQIFRAVTLPLMQALALWCLFRGMRVVGLRRAWGWLVAAGLFAGGALYTYNASRLFPLWIGVALLVWWIAARFDRRVLTRVLLVGVVMSVTAAPMIVYAIQRPDIFFGRLAEVTQAADSITLTESIIRHVLMFAIEGDPYFRYNIPGRPYFTWVEGVLLLIGIGAASYGLVRRGVSPRGRVGYALALLAPLMVIPSVISVSGLPPSHMRSLGMVPLIFVLVAIGVEMSIPPYLAAERVRDRAARTHRYAFLQRVAVPALGVAALAGGAIGTWAIYFQWASSAEVYYETDADLAAAVTWAVDQLQPGERLYIAARDKGHPTVMIANLPDVTWIGTDSLILPAPGERGLVLFPRSAPPQSIFLSALQSGQIDGLPTAPDGRAAFEAFRVTGAERAIASDAPANAHMRFAGIDAPPIRSGESGLITTTWHVVRPPDVGDLTPIIQIEDAYPPIDSDGQNAPRGIVFARGDAYMAGTDGWRPGETLMQQVRVTIPPLTPIGAYRVRMTWVARASDRYAPYLNADGSQAGIWTDVGMLTVTRPAAKIALNTITVPVSLDQSLAPSLRLIGISAPPETVSQGETLPITLYVQVTGESPAYAELLFMLVNTNGEGVQCCIERLPVQTWRAGDVWAIPMRPRLAYAGSWMLTVQVDDTPIVLAPITVEAVDRTFSPPSFDRALDASFGGQIALVGADVIQQDGELLLSPVWRADRAPDRDYTLFVHLVDADGTILAQVDVMPHGGAYPTARWLPDEYVTETIRLPDHPDGAVLRVGWYDAETGRRLSSTGRDATLENYAVVDYRNS